MVDKAGRLAGFTRSPGNAPEPHSLPNLLAGIPAHELIADKAYDTNAAPALLAARNIAVVIPSRARRREQRQYDPGVYEMRHLVANRFAVIASKEFPGVSGNSAQYSKRASMYGGMLNPVSVFAAFREAVSGRPAGGYPAVNRRLAL